MKFIATIKSNRESAQQYMDDTERVRRNSRLRDEKEIDVEINALAEPTGKGYCYPTEPTIKRRLKLHD
jgi:hypothetical protein